MLISFEEVKDVTLHLFFENLSCVFAPTLLSAKIALDYSSHFVMLGFSFPDKITRFWILILRFWNFETLEIF
jgi:hypothetical protein